MHLTRLSFDITGPHKVNSILRLYSAVRNVFNTYLRGETFPLFQPPFQRIFGTNDVSFKSPNIGRLELAKKWGVASS